MPTRIAGAKSAARAIAAALLTAASLRAQDDLAPTLDAVSIQDRPGFIEAVEQIATGREREGLAGLARVLQQFPADPDRFMLHFNVACGHARLGEREAAFAALDQAIELGYAIHPLRMENLEGDPDLDSLRADERYGRLLLRARAQRDEIRAGWERQMAPFRWLPPRSEPEAADEPPVPLLIVLHPYGAEREAFAREFYLPFCQEHGFALLAPGGRQIIAPGRFAWWAAPGDFLEQFRQDQRRVHSALEALRKEASIDPRRIYVTGMGQGAALGFAAAIRNPQWVRGAVLFGGGYAPATLSDWLERARSHGRRIALVHGDADPLYPFAPLPAFAEALQQKGLAIEIEKVGGGHDFAPQAVTAHLAARIVWIDAVPFDRPGAESPVRGR